MSYKNSAREDIHSLNPASLTPEGDNMPKHVSCTITDPPPSPCSEAGLSRPI